MAIQSHSAMTMLESGGGGSPLAIVVNNTNFLESFNRLNNGSGGDAVIASGGTPPYSYTYVQLLSTGGNIQFAETSGGPYNNPPYVSANDNPFLKESLGGGSGGTYTVEVTVEDSLGAIASDFGDWEFIGF
jgi:hypothetical protein